MPRTLPWMRGGGGYSDDRFSKGKASSEPQRKRKRFSEGIADHAKRRDRTPSTSPPPAPPSREAMKRGDEGWIMVEDEFFATAQSFTSHLHHAEYKRLKSLAARKTRDTLESIERPVTDDSASLSLRKVKVRKEKQTEISQRASKAVTRISGKAMPEENDEHDGNDDDDVLIRDKNLAALMHGTSIRRQNDEVPLTNLVGDIVRPNTRAAAGFDKQQRRPSPRPGIMYDTPNSRSTPLEKVVSSKSPELNEEDIETTDEEDLDNIAGAPRISTTSQSLIKPAPFRDKTHSPAGSKRSPSSSSARQPTLHDIQVRLGKGRGAKRLPRKDAGANDSSDKAVRLEEIPTFLV